jgi:hypothetical protein
MKLLSLLTALAMAVTFIVGCLAEDATEDIPNTDPVFSCDASSTFLEMCLEEPSSLDTQKASKSTCLSVKGTWSDAKHCPSGYKKKCPDGTKTNYYYGQTDGAKDCSELVKLNPVSNNRDF